MVRSCRGGGGGWWWRDGRGAGGDGAFKKKEGRRAIGSGCGGLVRETSAIGSVGEAAKTRVKRCGGRHLSLDVTHVSITY